MDSTIRWAALLGALLGQAALADGVPAADFRLPAGLEVTTWATTPMLYNPTNIDIDARGRVWVLEAVNYRGFKKEHHLGKWHEGGDRVMVLEDSDGDGTADKSTVFVQDEDLVAPLGIAVLGNRVFVSSSPSIILYTDVNNDGRFDPAVDTKEIFLTGFGGKDHDHGLHAMFAGPDGRWHINAGNAGPHIVTDKSGKTVRIGSWYTGGTPYNEQNTPGLAGDSGRAFVGGFAGAINPDGTGLAVYAHNFRNNYEHCLSSFGDVFQNDNDDQIATCRTTWLMEHANTGYSSADGTRSWRADQRPGQSREQAQWHQDDPGIVPYGDLYGAGSPTGIAFYEGDALGADYRGMLLSCEAGRNVIWGYRVTADGAGKKLERMSFLDSGTEDDADYKWSAKLDDKRKWFRPSDVAVGPDGAIYVADWYDPIVGGHAMHDRQGDGTIYRIAPKGRKLSVPAVNLDSRAGQIEALRSPAVNVRYLGFEKLKEQGDAATADVGALLKDGNPFIRARAVWLLAQLGPNGRKMVEDLLPADDAEMRVVALRALRRAGTASTAMLATLATDPSAAVRREVAVALRDVPFEPCRQILLTLADGYDGHDRSYLEAFGSGCDGKEAAIYPALLGRLGRPPLLWSEAFAGLIWRLHPPDAVTPLGLRALAPELDERQRRQAIDSLAFIASAAAAEAMAAAAQSGPEDLRSYAAWWLDFRRGNLWREFGGEKTPVVATAGLPPGPPVFDSGLVQAGRLVPVDVDITGAKHLYLVVTDGGNGNSCEWVDWAEPMLYRGDSKTDMTTLKWQSATTGYGEVNVNKNCRGLPIRMNGQSFAKGIGAHSPSIIVYSLGDSGFTRFTAVAGLDNGNAELGGTDHPGCGASASVVFQVYHDGPTAEAKASAFRAVVLDQARPEADRCAAAVALSATAAGGMQLIALASDSKLPPAVATAVTGRIHSNPDINVRMMADRYFPREVNGARLPPIAELAAMKGNAAAGKALFFGRATCAGCHRFQGEGKDIGPDLSQAGQKLDGATLLDALINPSAAIVFGYETVLVTCKDGSALSGFLVGAGDPLLLRDLNGNQHRVAKSDITAQSTLPTSIMPSVLNLGLNPQELADLRAYISQNVQ